MTQGTSTMTLLLLSLLCWALTIRAAIIPIEDQPDYVAPPASNLRGSETTPRFLGLPFEDTIIEGPPVVFEDEQSRRNLYDSRTAIGFLLHGPMGSPSISKDQLYGSLFSNGNSLKNQLSRCSLGQLQFNPTGWGVMDLYINAYQGTPQSDLAAMAEAAAIQALGGGYSNIRDAATHIVFVMPNRGDGYVGSAEVCPPGVSGTSFFGDVYALSLSVIMHEVGHNLGLQHATENGDTYGDTTGMMGISSGQTDGNPLQCYNACNHWTLGWFPNQRLDLSGGLSQPIVTNVVAFVDADQAYPGQYAIVKLPGNIYLQFNRAKEYNVGTRANIDQLVVVWDSSGNNSGETVFVTSLDAYNTYYNSGSVVVQICSVQIGGSVDYMVVSIGPGWADCNA
jgi:Gametolysin peptidase M11